ncbi:MAG: formyltransferase family protein [Bacteroidales bacterium]|jgi:methionyl-tRNA formyltransferase|nr:formyltransferase family protein [Bacteroidales bacterium]
MKNIFYFPIINKFSVRKFAEKHDIKVYNVLEHSSKETQQIFINRKINYVLMVSSNWLLKNPILSRSDTKIINAHSGWLPKHKGLDSIAWSIKENDPVGLTTHFINSGIDSGEILKFYKAKIEKGDDYNSINKKVGELQASAFFDTLIGMREKKIIPIPQNDKYKAHSPMTYEELCKIDELLS